MSNQNQQQPVNNSGWSNKKPPAGNGSKYRQNLIEEGIEMLKQRQMRKQTENQIEVLENRVRLLQRHELNTKRKIVIDQQRLGSLQEVREHAVQQKNLQDMHKVQEEIQLEKKRHLVNKQKLKLMESRDRQRVAYEQKTALIAEEHRREGIERREQIRHIKSAIRQQNVKSVKQMRREKDKNRCNSQEDMDSPSQERSTAKKTSNSREPRQVTAKNNYIAKLNENKQAVAENQEKLQKLLELEQKLSAKIQKNIEKQHDLINSQTSIASAFNMLATTNQSSVKHRYRMNQVGSASEQTPNQPLSRQPLPFRNNRLPMTTGQSNSKDGRSQLQHEPNQNNQQIKHFRPDGVQRPASTIPTGSRQKQEQDKAHLQMTSMATTTDGKLDQGANKQLSGGQNIVDVQVPKRPMTTANVNQRGLTRVPDSEQATSNDAFMNVQNVNEDDEDDAYGDDEFVEATDNQPKQQQAQIVADQRIQDSPSDVYNNPTSDAAVLKKQAKRENTSNSKLQEQKIEGIREDANDDDNYSDDADQNDEGPQINQLSLAEEQQQFSATDPASQKAHLTEVSREINPDTNSSQKKKIRPVSGGNTSQQSLRAQNAAQVKRIQRPSDINRKSSRQSSEFYRSTSQVSHDQAAASRVNKPDGSCSTSAIITKEEDMRAIDHMRVASADNKKMLIDSSDYEDDDDGQYEEVGYDEFDEDEEEIIVPPQQMAINSGMHYGSGSNKRSGSIIMSTPLNELKENDDEEYSEAGEDDEPSEKEQTKGLEKAAQDDDNNSDHEYQSDQYHEDEEETKQAPAAGGLSRVQNHMNLHTEKTGQLRSSHQNVNKTPQSVIFSQQDLENDDRRRSAEMLVDQSEQTKGVNYHGRISSQDYRKQKTMPLSSQSEDKEVRESNRRTYFDETESVLTPPMESNESDGKGPARVKSLKMLPENDEEGLDAEDDDDDYSDDMEF